MNSAVSRSPEFGHVRRMLQGHAIRWTERKECTKLHDRGIFLRIFLLGSCGCYGVTFGGASRLLAITLRRTEPLEKFQNANQGQTRLKIS